MFLLFNIIFCLFTLRYELEKKSSLVTRAFSAKSCTRDTDSLHSCTRLRLVQEMACLYHECKILPRKHSYPNLIPILQRHQLCTNVLGVHERSDNLLMTMFDASMIQTDIICTQKFDPIEFQTHDL